MLAEVLMANSFDPGTGSKKRKNIIGQRFGENKQLIIIAFLGKRKKSGSCHMKYHHSNKGEEYIKNHFAGYIYYKIMSGDL